MVTIEATPVAYVWMHACSFVWVCYAFILDSSIQMYAHAFPQTKSMPFRVPKNPGCHSSPTLPPAAPKPSKYSHVNCSSPIITKRDLQSLELPHSLHLPTISSSHITADNLQNLPPLSRLHNSPEISTTAWKLYKLKRKKCQVRQTSGVEIWLNDKSSKTTCLFIIEFDLIWFKIWMTPIATMPIRYYFGLFLDIAAWQSSASCLDEHLSRYVTSPSPCSVQKRSSVHGGQWQSLFLNNEIHVVNTMCPSHCK